MKEYVLVQFICTGVDKQKLHSKLKALGDEFRFLTSDYEYEEDEDANFSDCYIFNGEISSVYASMIKLQDSFLAERMRISYIPDDLKDKYRSK